MKKFFILTNNPMVRDRYYKEFEVQYFSVDLLGILKYARDKIHLGYKLGTHPLSGSVKPNETPYKSIIMCYGDALDLDSLSIIENSIMTAEKFLKGKRPCKWNESVLKDFQIIDLSLIAEFIKDNLF